MNHAFDISSMRCLSRNLSCSHLERFLSSMIVTLAILNLTLISSCLTLTLFIQLGRISSLFIPALIEYLLSSLNFTIFTISSTCYVRFCAFSRALNVLTRI